MKRIVFSIPAHECIDCLIWQIKNIKSKVPNCLIIIYLSGTNNFFDNYSSLKNIENVIINLDHQKTYWGDNFYQHFSNYIFLKENNIEWDYWSFEASNTTLIKNDLYYHIIKYDALVLSNRDMWIKPNQTKFNYSMHTNWWDKKFLKDFKLMQMVKENNFEIFAGYVEGMVFKKELMDEMAKILIFYKFYEYKEKSNEMYPREELLFQTVFFNKFNSKKYTHTYCNPHDPKLEEINFILRSFKNIYSIKPTPRKIGNEIRIEHQQMATIGYEEYFEKKRSYDVDEFRFKFKEDMLIDKVFEFKNKKFNIGKIKFLTNGQIGIYKNDSEFFWQVDKNGDLYFLNKDGFVTSIFYVEKNGSFLGDFIAHPIEEFKKWHEIKPIY